MSEVFGADYASSYDDFYREKDYLGECILVESIIERFGQNRMRSILDLGCGTGRHAEIWAKHGHEVTGIDRSETMLGQAVARTEALPNVRFFAGDIREVRLNQKFDVVTLMFAVLGYQTKQDDLERTLDTIAIHLRQGGLLVFDVWYGPAVLAQGADERVRTIRLSDGVVRRRAQGVIDMPTQTCEVHYRVERESQGESAVSEEIHSLRFFFPNELEILLQQKGLELLRIGGFPDFDADPDESTWNAMGVARFR